MEQLYIGIDVEFMSSPMPRKIKGFLNKDNERYFIVINSEISIEEQKKAISHEVNHLLKDHFRCDDIEDVERRM
jgi:hypothetical protein